MTGYEAIKRCEESGWTLYVKMGDRAYVKINATTPILAKDLSQDDWRIEEPTVTVTRSQVVEAWSMYFGVSHSCLEPFLKHLGLE